MYPPEHTNMDEIEETLVPQEDEVPMTTGDEESEPENYKEDETDEDKTK